jgi:hypothetical protein
VITDLTLARACVDTYVPGAVPTWNTDEVHVFLTQQDGYAIIAFKGSASIRDWLQDFDAFVIPGGFNHKDLGLVHAGFFDDVEDVFGDILKGLPSDPIAVTGHSKGAAEALIFAALLTASTDRVIARVSTFGTPRPGMLNGFLTGIAGNDYRNRSDPVCSVPPYLHHPRKMVDLNVPPLPDDPWGPLADHHMALYLDGMTAPAI